MKGSGPKSSPPPHTLLFADPTGLASWDFVSYEDAAHVMVSAMETTEYDNKHISALTKAAAPKAEL